MIPKGKRPAPETYLKRRYIRRHLKNFKAGASCIVSKELLERHHGDSIGKADNSQFIMMKSEMDSVLIKVMATCRVSNTNWESRRCVETSNISKD